jgi:hypothetical protein
LAGMDERAKGMGARFAVRRRLDSGTEVELSIPAAVAYSKSAVERPMVSGEAT